MARNKLSDLNNHLFAQLERLSNEDLSTEELKAELGRSKAICDVAKNITETAKVVLQAAEFIAETNTQNSNVKRLAGDFKEV